mgnify:FL=1
MTTVNKYGYARLHEDPLLHVPHAYIGEKVPVSYTATDVKIRYNYDIIAATGTTTAIPPLPSTSAPSTVQLWGGRRSGSWSRPPPCTRIWNAAYWKRSYIRIRPIRCVLVS